MPAVKNIASYLLCALMLSSAWATIHLTPQQHLASTATQIDLAIAIPTAFGDWKVDPNVAPVRPSPVQQETLDKTYDQIVSRTYVNSDNARIMLTVAYGSSQTNKARAHRQEVCYAAQGFKIGDLMQSNQRVLGVEIPMTQFIGTQVDRTEPVTYWFTIGDSLVRSYWDRQIAQLKYAVLGAIPDGYLFRVSSISSVSETAFANQIAFSNTLMKAVDPRLAERLIGSVPPP